MDASDKSTNEEEKDMDSKFGKSEPPEGTAPTAGAQPPRPKCEDWEVYDANLGMCVINIPNLSQPSASVPRRCCSKSNSTSTVKSSRDSTTGYQIRHENSSKL